MTNPMMSVEFTGVTHVDVTVGRHVIVGSGSVVLPVATLEDEVAIVALSLVRGECRTFGNHAETSAHYVRGRKCDLLDAERRLLANIRG